MCNCFTRRINLLFLYSSTVGALSFYDETWDLSVDNDYPFSGMVSSTGIEFLLTREEHNRADKS